MFMVRPRKDPSKDERASAATADIKRGVTSDEDSEPEYITQVVVCYWMPPRAQFLAYPMPGKVADTSLGPLSASPFRRYTRGRDHSDHMRCVDDGPENAANKWV